MRPFFQSRKIRRNQRADELVLVAHQRRLRHQHDVLELVFDRLRRDELAARCLEQLFLAVGDVEKSIGVEVADVAGAEPALAVETSRHVAAGFCQ